MSTFRIFKSLCLMIMFGMVPTYAMDTQPLNRRPIAPALEGFGNVFTTAAYYMWGFWRSPETLRQVLATRNKARIKKHIEQLQTVNLREQGELKRALQSFVDESDCEMVKFMLIRRRLLGLNAIDTTNFCFTAARNEDVEMVRLLHDFGYRGLHYTITMKQPEVASFLLDNGESAHDKDCGFGISPVEVAVEHGRSEMVDFLKRNGVAPAALLHASLKYDKAELVDELLTQHADVQKCIEETDLKEASRGMFEVLAKHSVGNAMQFTDCDGGPVAPDVARKVCMFLDDVHARGHEHNIFMVRLHNESAGCSMKPFAERRILYLGQEHVDALSTGEPAGEVRFQYGVVQKIAKLLAGDDCAQQLSVLKDLLCTLVHPDGIAQDTPLPQLQGLVVDKEALKNADADLMTFLVRHGLDRTVEQFTDYDGGPVTPDVERTVRSFLQEVADAGYDHRIFTVREYNSPRNAAVCLFGDRHIIFIGSQYTEELMNNDWADTLRMQHVIAHEVGHTLAGHFDVCFDEANKDDMAVSREHELEADRIGYEIMAKLGYLGSRESILSVLSHWGERVKIDQFNKEPSGTHPSARKRLAQMCREQAGRSHVGVSFGCALLAHELGGVLRGSDDVDIADRIKKSSARSRLAQRLNAVGVDVERLMQDHAHGRQLVAKATSLDAQQMG